MWRYWWLVARLRDQRPELRPRLPKNSSFFLTGGFHWLWTGEHRAVGDATLSNTVLLARALLVTALAIFLGVFITR